MNDDRWRSELCEQGKHDDCSKSPMVGICGCECHDYLDNLDEQFYGDSDADGNL